MLSHFSNIVFSLMNIVSLYTVYGLTHYNKVEVNETLKLNDG